MARVKISEFQAKNLLLPNYTGVALTSTNYLSVISSLPRNLTQTNLVVKVDQGIKKRGKLGLVKVNLSPRDIPPIIKKWAKLGWSSFLIEPVVEHAPEAEHYLALERTRAGWQVSYSDKGGIDVESSWDSVQRVVLIPQGQALTGSPSNARAGTPKVEGLALLELIEPLLPLLDANHISFLEMNPILIRDHKIIPLDMAVEVDNTGSILQPVGARHASPAEIAVAVLDSATPASLKFKLINPEGRIWMLLSGGGASLVLADEVADQGMGADLANYGEYSGAPTNDDVYSYTKIILATMLHSKAPQLHRSMALVIAAGIANFTDVAKTFNGIIRALNEVKSKLKKAKLKVFVRRGGPNEAMGLKMMGDFLTSADIPHLIHTHETPLTQVISDVDTYLSVGARRGSPVRSKNI